MLDNRAYGFIEFLGQIPCGLQVHDIVVRKLFALNLCSVRHAAAGAVAVHCSPLVRILAIAQVHDLAEREAQILGEARLGMQVETTVGTDTLERGRNCRIVCGGGCKCLLRQPPPGSRRNLAFRFRHLLGDGGIIGG